MKKIMFVASLFASMGAQAVELGITTNRDTANTDRTGYGVTVGQKFDKVGITAGFDRYTKGNALDKYTIVGSYDVSKTGSAIVAVKGGVAYLDQKNTNDGYAALVGVGISYPLNKEISLTADYRYQAGQSRISNVDGSTISAGVKYSF